MENFQIHTTRERYNDVYVPTAQVKQHTQPIFSYAYPPHAPRADRSIT